MDDRELRELVRELATRLDEVEGELCRLLDLGDWPACGLPEHKGAMELLERARELAGWEQPVRRRLGEVDDERA